jgi:uncharacterized protein (TIGR00255 family)
MTGYGRGSAESDGRRATVEIRSVNHRFLDLKLRGALLDPALEDALGGRVRKQVERGSVTVTVRIEQRVGVGAFKIDLVAAKHVHGELVKLATSLGLGGGAGASATVDLALICAQPGVVVAADAESETENEQVAACVLEAADGALATLITMRDAEGAALVRDLTARVAALAAVAETVERVAATQPDDSRRRLEERIARLLQHSKVEVDAGRLAQEVALLADKQDVTEELVRLRSHLDQVSEVLASPDGGAVGRRLDFLVQELGREVNTIASKSSAAEIARVIVEAKAELEKIREQVQNIE